MSAWAPVADAAGNTPRAPARNLAALLWRAARTWPALPAVAHGLHVRLDYRGLADRAARLAAGLRSAGMPAGARVALVAANHPASVEALLACWWAGLVAVPVNSRLHPRELGYMLEHSGARLVLADASWADAIRHGHDEGLRVIALDSPQFHALCEAAPIDVAAVASTDPAWLFYTSGTTGRPKGVVLSHANLLAMTHAFLGDVAPIDPGDAILHAAPLSHGSGLYVVPHVARAALHVVPESGGFEAAELVRLSQHWRNSLFFAAPTMVKRFVREPAVAQAPLSNLKCVVYGGGPMYVEDAKAAYAVLGPRLAQIYGQGESPMTITAMDRAQVTDAIARGDDARLGSVGTAQTGMEIAIAVPGGDPDALDRGLAGDPAALGEVLVRGPAVMQGYWQDAKTSARTLAGGWLHTGDVGAIDADGFLTLKDRSKDLVISGGSNIYPREVEEVLLRHPDVLEAAVVGRPHGEWGEEVVACIVPRVELRGEAARRALAQALDAFCLDAIARYKRPRDYRFMAELPKNTAGKVLKTELRAQVAKPQE
jgi:long-chain acyl-CoA synthetase